VLKGDQWVKPGQTVEALYFGQGKKGETFLVMGTDPPNLMWSTPLLLSARAVEYVKALPDLPSDHRRLKFFQDYLEDPDETLATDAYDEFAKTPYDGVMALKEDMDHEKLLGWIQNPDIPASRKRLYFTMLGVCGKPEDARLLEKLMHSDDRKDKAGLDALIACYLILKGTDGLPLVEQLFLKNAKAEYADTYSAIMALRFHGTETDVLPKERLLESLHYMLDRPELADLVIPDLARWEDWEAMPRLVKLFKQADEKSSWVRVPVINYLRACPLPEAEKQIAELEKIDPEAVRRANTFFPFGGLSGAEESPSEESTEDSSAETADQQPGVPAEDEQPASEESAAARDAAPPEIDAGLIAQADPQDRSAEPPAADEPTAADEPSATKADGAFPSESASPAGQAIDQPPASQPPVPEETVPELRQSDPTGEPGGERLEELAEPVEQLSPPARQLLRVGVPLVAGLALAFTMRGILGGWRTR
jgi:hypothetical protein